MALEETQRSYRGLVMGRGTGIRIRVENGVESLSVRRGDDPYPRNDGTIPGEHLANEKLIELMLGVEGDPAAVEPTIQAIRQAFRRSAGTEFEYRFRNPGQDERLLYARPIAVGRPRNSITEGGGWLEIPVVLVAADPFIYSAELYSAPLPLFDSAGGGFDLPVVNFPINMTASSAAFAIAANNGIEDSYPTVQVEFSAGGSGDFDGVLLTNLTTGATYQQDSTLTPGQRLTAVFGSSVSLISVSGADRYSEWALPRNPFSLAPGANILKLEILGTSPTADVAGIISWRDVY